jgi:tRNA threonylcarbamoyladenosine biosynthesis protein TsaB
MMILAFDTTTSACAAAICRDGEVLAERSSAMERGHAEALIPMLGDVLADAKLSYSDLDAIAVTRGPGAFTGIRIGLASARGLALATGLPVIGVTTLEALAATARAQTRRDCIAVIMNTKRRDYFVQVFDRDLSPRSEPAVVAGNEIRAQLGRVDSLNWEYLAIAGDGLTVLEDDLAEGGAELLPAVVTPAPLYIAELATGRSGAAPPTPIYLRPPEARLPNAGR